MTPRLLIFSVLFFLFAVPEPAFAACVREGDTVTCSGLSGDSFLTTDRVDLTVLSDGLVSNIPVSDNNGSCPLSFPAIVVGSGSRVENLGFIIGTGACASGIDAGNDVLVINRNFIETFDDVGHGIATFDNSTVIHSGRLMTRGQSGFGILMGTNANVTTETGSILSTSGAGAPGIYAYDGAMILTEGSISTSGDFGNGIEVFGAGVVDQRGTVTTTGLGSTGIRVFGGGAQVTNSGVIVASTITAPRIPNQQAGGIDADASFIDIVNSGTILGQRFGIRAQDFLTLAISNSGTISASADPSFDPDAAAVVVRAPASSEAVFINSGEISAGGGIPAVSGGAEVDRLTNSGSITGDIRLGGGDDFYIVTSGGQTHGTVDLGDGIDAVAVVGTAGLTRPFVGVEVLNKLNLGTLTIGSDIAVQSRAQVSAGVMDIVAGARLSAPTIAAVSSGVLTGSGTLTGNVENLGQIVVGPDASLQILGSYTQTSEGRLQATLTLGGQAPMSVGGPVTLAGSLSPIYASTNGPRAGDTYALIALAGSGPTVSGEFDRIDGLTPYFFAGEMALSTDGDTLELRIIRRSYASAAATPSQRAVATALDHAFALGAAGLQRLFEAVDPLTPEAARSVFNSLAPHTPVAAFSSADLSWRATETALGQWLELGPSDGVPGSTRAWGQVGHRGGTSRGNDPGGKFATDTRTAIAGIDYALNDGTRIGFALASSDNAVQRLAGGARADATYTYGALYAGHAWQNIRIAAAFMLSDGNPRLVRNGLFSVHETRQDVDLGGGFAAVTSAANLGPFIVKPSLSLRISRTRMDDIAETGADGLIVSNRTRWAVRPEIGLRTVGRPGKFHPYAALTAAYDLNDAAHGLEARFAAEPAATFSLLGPGPRRLWMTAQAGVNIELATGLMARIGFEGVVNDSLGGNGFTAGVSYRW